MTEQNYIGIGNALHDTSIAALINGEFKYRKSERAFGIKHHQADDKWFKSVLDEWGVDEKNSKIVYTDSGKKRFGRRVRKPYHGEDYVVEGDRICLDHHTAHVYSAQSYASQHAVFDGRGSGGYGGRWTGLTISADGQKRYKNLSIGKFLSYVGYAMEFKGMEVDFPGKIMGLQAYGTPIIFLTYVVSGFIKVLIVKIQSSKTSWQLCIRHVNSYS